MGKKKKKNKKHNKQKKFKDRLAGEVLDLLSKEPKKTFNYKQIASRLGLNDPNKREILLSVLHYLDDKDEILGNGKGKFKYKQRVAYVKGKVDMTQRGAAYVISEDIEDDVYIAPKDMNNALNDDIVKVYLFAKRKKGKPEGEITEIIERAKTSFVGKVEISEDFAFLVPDDKKMHVDIFIPLSKIKDAKDGQKAIAEITDWPNDATNPFGRIEKVLGDPGNHEVEMHSILAEYALPYEFPDKVEKAADKIPEDITEEEIGRRRDMREVPTFTIDPDDAQDFDDALSFRELDDGTFEVGVHIADVSHYVEPGSIIDQEAYKRATSVYLVDRVIPMLPERLSNGLCSLRPEEDKLSFSAVFKMDSQAKIHDEWFGRTVIRSDKRFTYKEAQGVLDKEEGPLNKELTKVNDLAKKLRKERVEHGSLEIESDEVKFELDEEGKPIEVTQKVTLEANLLIEDMMLLANRKVAAKVGKKEQPSPFIYRIHDTPDDEKLKLLKLFVGKFGYDLHFKVGRSASYAINKLLKDVKDTPEESVISYMAIRSMAKAIYSTENIGHYGLAFDYYTHFTSPIRRYPDLMVHRLLQEFLEKGRINRKTDDLESICKHSSERERKAIDAERDSIKYKQVEYLMDRVGEVFKGIVSGMTDWGLFVQLKENKCEGLIRLKSIDDDMYYFDEKNYRIIGASSGHQFDIGDELNVRVVGTDLERKELDLELEETEV